MLDDITRRILEFRDARDWKQFHSARNLAASISIEAGELLEIFQWSSDETLSEVVESRSDDIARELADVMIYCLLLAEETGINLTQALTNKLVENEAKYPAGKAHGKSAKYTEL